MRQPPPGIGTKRVDEQRAHLPDFAAAADAVAEFEEHGVFRVGFSDEPIGDTLRGGGLTCSDIPMKD